MRKRFQLLVIALLLAATVLAACATFGGLGAEKTVYVGPYQVPCEGVAPQLCMLVKEKPSDEWTLYYDEIEGFDYEPGFEYELRVLEEKVENPPADASSIRWTLLEVISKDRSLEGTTWLLESYVKSEGEMVDVLPGSLVTALFADGQLGGNASCNAYNAQYTAQGGKISIGVGASTMMYCPPEELMAQEMDYLSALGKAAFHLVTEEELVIADATGRTILRYGVQEPTSLVGTDWQLTRYSNGKGGYQSVMTGTGITALFGEDGSLTGSAGCNNYVSSYQLDGTAGGASGRISIGPAATTRKMCPAPEGIMEQEAAYLAALQSATTFEIKGDELEMRDAEGTRMASYVAKAGVEGEGPSEEALANMTYQSEWTQSGEAPLTDSEYREQAAPGSATETVVMLTEHIAHGQLNGQPGAAVVLVTDPGGSGTFYDLAVVMEQGGQPVNVATTSLGDRVQINYLTIENNEIVVDMVNQGPDDPMCCPAQHVVQTYALQGDQLVQTSSQVVDGGSGERQELTGVVWQWVQFADPSGQITIDDPSQYTVEFKPDGKVHVKADCNMGNGTYTTEGKSISIEIMAVTMAICPPGSLSDQFLQNLNAASLYFSEGDNLMIDLQADSGTMTFAPAK
jgi:heat shock protein HslJ/predicted small secreted protein